jgi:anti-sigma regulatory factor (Ser/Thr protein kinase)
MDASTSLLLIVVSRRDQIEAVHAPLDSLMQRLGLGDERRWRVDLAVREALANAIVHGNREDPTTTVRRRARPPLRLLPSTT